jgi:anti-sigma factor RsiW
MAHPDSQRLEAYFDNEISAPDAADIDLHVEQCAECRAQLQDLAQLRAALRQDLGHYQVPQAMRTRLARALDQESGADSRRPSRAPFWAGVLGGACATAMAAVIAFVIFFPPPGNALVDQLVDAHLRSLMPDHLIDVVSTDKHTVKPWFAGHADVSPAVGDFEQQGYRLMGGRADYVDRQRAAVIVYQHGAHLINVFSWADDPRGLPRNLTRNGYQLVFWRSGDLDYCAVSDTAPDELQRLVGLLQALGELQGIIPGANRDPPG